MNASGSAPTGQRSGERSTTPRTTTRTSMRSPVTLPSEEVLRLTRSSFATENSEYLGEDSSRSIHRDPSTTNNLPLIPNPNPTSPSLRTSPTDANPNANASSHPRPTMKKKQKKRSPPRTSSTSPTIRDASDGSSSNNSNNNRDCSVATPVKLGSEEVLLLTQRSTGSLQPGGTDGTPSRSGLPHSPEHEGDASPSSSSPGTGSRNRSSRRSKSRSKSKSRGGTPPSNSKKQRKPRKSLKKAVKKEKESVDAVVAAAIRNYQHVGAGGETQNDQEATEIPPEEQSPGETPSPNERKSKKRRGRRSSAASRSGVSAVTSSSASASPRSGIKSPRPRTISVEKEHEHEHESPTLRASSSRDSATATTTATTTSHPEDFGRTPSPPRVRGRSIDRAGAVAVFPSDSVHFTQHRSRSDPQRIPNDNYIYEEDLIEAVPEPSESQRFDASVVALVPPETVLSRQRTGTGRASVSASTSNPSTVLNSNSNSNSNNSSNTPRQTEDEIFGEVVHDPGSGTVRAQAISSEDYYAEVRRRVQEEELRRLREQAVVALDVVPIPIGSNGTETNGTPTKYNPTSIFPASMARERKRRWIWWGILGVCGVVAVVAIGVSVFLTQTKNNNNNNNNNSEPPRPPHKDPPPHGGPPPPDDSSQNTPPEIQDPILGVGDIMNDMFGESMMESNAGKIMAGILPHFALTNIVSDAKSPQSKAFQYVIEHEQEALKSLESSTDPLTDSDQRTWDENRLKTIFALVTIYHSLAGNDWFTNGNWLDPTFDVCQWHGVTCQDEMAAKYFPKTDPNDTATSAPMETFGVGNRRLHLRQAASQAQRPWRGLESDNGAEALGDEEESEDATTDYHVTFDRETLLLNTIPIRRLDLNANNLEGTLPDELGLLTNVYQFIDLDMNAIKGSIPSHLGLLSGLEGLVLSSNMLSSTLPSEIGQMVSLKNLTVSNNPGLTGVLPVEINHWDEIEHLDIFGTGFEGEVPTEFCLKIKFRKTQMFDDLVVRASCPEPIVCTCCTACCTDGREASCIPQK